MTAPAPPRMLIETRWTRDLRVEYRDGSWEIRPLPPSGRGWFVADARPERRTCWRRVILAGVA
jgi:hypothetical protein